MKEFVLNILICDSSRSPEIVDQALQVYHKMRSDGTWEES
jgi:hypothetical protein